MTMSDDEMIAEATYALTGEELPPRSVVEALLRVMRDLPAIGKDSYNKDQGWNFRGIEAVTARAQPLFAKHGVLPCPRVKKMTVEQIVKGGGEKGVGKPWLHRELEVEYVMRGINGPDDCIVLGPFNAEGDDNADKSSNKAMTQAYKQMLLQVLCISDRKDDPDETHVERDAPRQEPVDPPVSPEVIETTIRNVLKAGYTEAEFTDQVALVTGRDDMIVLKSEWPLVRDAWAAYKHDHPKDRDAAAGVLPGEGDTPSEATELGARARKNP